MTCFIWSVGRHGTLLKRGRGRSEDLESKDGKRQVMRQSEEVSRRVEEGRKLSEKEKLD